MLAGCNNAQSGSPAGIGDPGAMCCRGRLAAREVEKVFGFDTETLNRLSAMVGSFEWRGSNDISTATSQAWVLISAKSELPSTLTSVFVYRICHGI